MKEMTINQKIEKYGISRKKEVKKYLDQISFIKELIDEFQKFLDDNKVEDGRVHYDIQDDDGWHYISGIELRVSVDKTEDDLAEDVILHEMKALQEQKALREETWRRASIPSVAKSLVRIHDIDPEFAICLAYFKSTGKKLRKGGYKRYLNKFPSTNTLIDILESEANALIDEYNSFLEKNK